MPKMFSHLKCFNFFFAYENMKKPTSKFAKPAQIQPKSQFLFHKNLPPRDFSIMTLGKAGIGVKVQKIRLKLGERGLLAKYQIVGMFCVDKP